MAPDRLKFIHLRSEFLHSSSFSVQSVTVSSVTGQVSRYSILTFSQGPGPSQMLDQLSKNITRCGLSNSTLNYLRVSLDHLVSAPSHLVSASRLSPDKPPT